MHAGTGGGAASRPAAARHRLQPQGTDCSRTAPTSVARMPRITVVQHGSDVPLDRFTAWLGDVRIAVVRPYEGDPVPAAAEVGDGLLVLGGSMSAHDDGVAPWLPATRRLLADAVDADVPTLGVCLGHQLLAEATGGHVTVGAPPGREAGIVEIAWRPAAAADPVLGRIVGGDEPRASGVPEDYGRVRQPSMHADAVVELPPDAQWLAHSATYPFQAMRVGSALGVQFHPEASPELLAGWARSHDLDVAATLAEARAHDAEVAAVGRAIAEGFVSHVRGAVPASR